MARRQPPVPELRRRAEAGDAEAMVRHVAPNPRTFKRAYERAYPSSAWPSSTSLPLPCPSNPTLYPALLTLPSPLSFSPPTLPSTLPHLTLVP